MVDSVGNLYSLFCNCCTVPESEPAKQRRDGHRGEEKKGCDPLDVGGDVINMHMVKGGAKSMTFHSFGTCDAT